MHEETALAHLREARAAMLTANEAAPSRKLSVAITQTDTAILWLEYDLQGKRVVNEERQAP